MKPPLIIVELPMGCEVHGPSLILPSYYQAKEKFEAKGSFLKLVIPLGKLCKSISNVNAINPAMELQEESTIVGETPELTTDIIKPPIKAWAGRKGKK